MKTYPCKHTFFEPPLLRTTPISQQSKNQTKSPSFIFPPDNPLHLDISQYGRKALSLLTFNCELSVKNSYIIKGESKVLLKMEFFFIYFFLEANMTSKMTFLRIWP